MKSNYASLNMVKKFLLTSPRLLRHDKPAKPLRLASRLHGSAQYHAKLITS